MYETGFQTRRIQVFGCSKSTVESKGFPVQPLDFLPVRDTGEGWNPEHADRRLPILQDNAFRRRFPAEGFSARKTVVVGDCAEQREN